MLEKNYCPLGKSTCVGCASLSVTGCMALNKNEAYGITSVECHDLWERRRAELMKLPKESLVEMIIGFEPFIFNN